jgi:hypothetical protein
MTLSRLRRLQARASRVMAYTLSLPPENHGRWERACRVLLKIHQQMQMGETT